MKDKIKAYGAILETIEFYADEIKDDYVLPSTQALEQIIENLRVSDRFGIPLKSVKDNYHGWLSVKDNYHGNDWMILGLFGEEHNRTISWSDDGSQPEDEWLFKVGFSTGPYIFGDYFKSEYPKKTFEAFFQELKSYGPAFCDTNNKSLYFREDVAKVVYDNFWPIFEKYKAQVQEELKEQRKQELMKELEKLSEEKF